MYAIASFFLGTLFLGFIGSDAVDHVKPPLGTNLEFGAEYGAGKVVMVEGIKMLEVPLWRSYLAGCILLGIAPCTAMVLVWGSLAKGNDGHTLVMVAINSLTMLVLYGVLGGFLLGVGKLPVPWQALLLSIGVYVALPLVTGFVSRRWLIAAKGEAWFKDVFLHFQHFLTPVTVTALLATLVLLFSFKGETIVQNPLTILWIAIPLFSQTVLIFDPVVPQRRRRGGAQLEPGMLSASRAASYQISTARSWSPRSRCMTARPCSVLTYSLANSAS